MANEPVQSIDPVHSIRTVLVARGLVLPESSWVQLAGGRVNRVWRVDPPRAGRVLPRPGSPDRTQASGSRQPGAGSAAQAGTSGSDVSPAQVGTDGATGPCTGPGDGSAPRGAVVVKLYAADGGTLLFPNDPAAEASVLRALAGSGLAPHLRGSVPTDAGMCLVYDHVPGVCWGSGAGADTPGQDAASVARVLARVHQATLPPGLRRIPDPAGTAEMLLHQCAGGDALAALCPGTVPAPVPDDCLLHGDAVAGNLICGPHGITPIDWQCPAQGDPAEDIAMFLSPAMQWLYRGAVLTGAQMDAFLAAYPGAVTVARYRLLAPQFHWRMAAYCLWRAERGAQGYRAALALEIAALQK